MDKTKMEAMEKEYVNFEEAARFLCVSTSKLYKMTHKSEIKYYKVGRLNVFGLDDLREYIENRMVPSVGQIRQGAHVRVMVANHVQSTN